MGPVIAPIPAAPALPVDAEGVRERLRLTLLGAGLALLGLPVALIVAIAWVVALPLSLTLVGLVLLLAVVPAARALADLHRDVAGRLLHAEIAAGYLPDAGGPLARLGVWVRDPARWRDLAHLWFSTTGGFVMSALPALLLVSPVVHLAGLTIALVTGGAGTWWFLVLLGAPMLVAWWFVTVPLVRARASVDRAMLGHGRVEELERRVAEVAVSRAETLDHTAAEVRRIERDLHDGAQARLASVGMTVGLAEKLMATDPDAAAALLREARETTVGALEDIRSVVRGIHPPALADHGLMGAVKALVVPLPVPVTLTAHVEAALPAPVESAVYFAVAECLANTVKHSGATRAWVRLTHDGAVLRAEVGDDGAGGADPAAGSGLAGVSRRLAAFDGTMHVDSPAGGGTRIELEVPCPTPEPRDRSGPSSRRTRPSSASG